MKAPPQKTVRATPVPTRKSGPRKRSHSDALLLEAASRLLAERSHVDISLSEIAEASGLNSALISYHFGNKEGLLLALVRRDAEAALAELAQLLALEISPQEKIRLHIHGVIHTYAKVPYLNRLMHMLLDSSNAGLSKEIARFFIEPLVAAQTRIIEDGVAIGVFRRVDPMNFYFTVIGACDILFCGRPSLENVFNVGQLTSEICDQHAEFVADTALRVLKVSI